MGKKNEVFLGIFPEHIDQVDYFLFPKLLYLSIKHCLEIKLAKLQFFDDYDRNHNVAIFRPLLTSFVKHVSRKMYNQEILRPLFLSSKL